VSLLTVVVTLRHGVLSGCIMCGHSTGLYWPWEDRFHPLHEGCIPRLLEHWKAMLVTSSEEDGPRARPTATTKPRRSAYARRQKAAEEAGAPAMLSAVAPVIPAAVQANPWWRPGLSPDAPWYAVAESTVGRKHTPSSSREWALNAMRHAKSLASQDREDGVIVLGGYVVAPDASIVAEWGVHAPPFADPLFRPLDKVGGGSAETWGWERCRGCDTWRWPGCWLLEVERLCQKCAGDDDGRPWPVDPPSTMVEPPPPPPKSKAKGKPETFD
jgi:hypothetical protein